MSGTSSKSQRSSTTTSPFRSRKGSPSPSLSPSPAINRSGGRPGSSSSERSDLSKPKENVTVAVRFRPLSVRELKKGDEIAWYADGESTARNESNPKIAYAFDRVFGPATTTRHVYDVAGHHVVSGAMDGVNGTIFAYGVTSSGKTHTMRGVQKSPGMIPLAIKDVFEIIQETPGREFLLRVSYLEIYNEVINDLLDPTAQNLRIREDTQGTYVEGVKEEVVLSPAHALSMIATGEEHRHVGSNNFNLLSSRSHTIFTLTIESSPRGFSQGVEDVTLSQLHLIDLAGSESSKTETNGLRRKEGSYINKSLLTLGTVISKLTDGKATHIPYRDSKLTRLLQSSLSGHGRISLICTVTPASSNSEETHNTLKFAHRSKHVEIKASQNKILDENSLIKKYQKEISNLQQELQKLKHGTADNPCTRVSTQEVLLEAGQVRRQSRLEEEEQAKAALMGRIQRLTKLILVSTKNSMSTSIPQKAVCRRHSFGEDELAYLPNEKREYIIEDDDDGRLDSEVLVERRSNSTNLDEIVKDYKKNKRRGMLGWFKSRKPEHFVGLSAGADSQSSASGSPASCSTSSQNRVMVSDVQDGQRKSVSRKGDDPSIANSYPERTEAGELLSVGIWDSQVPQIGKTISDQMDLLNEQVKLLGGEVALCSSSLKRLSEQAVNNPEDSGVEEQMQKLKSEVCEKKLRIRELEQRIIGSLEAAPKTSSIFEMSQALMKLATQLNEKTFELEIKSADNRILQEQLQVKISENTEMQETILLLRQQLSTSVDISSSNPGQNQSAAFEDATFNTGPPSSSGKNWDGKELPIDATTPTSVISLNRFFSRECSKDCNDVTTSNSQVIMQAAEIESLKQENVKLAEEKDGLEIHSKKLAEEASYAKELAAAAAVELQNLTGEVTKLSYENTKLIGELHYVKEGSCEQLSNIKQRNSYCAGFDTSLSKIEHGQLVEDLQEELNARYQKEALLEVALSEKEQVECELRKRLDEAKRHEEDLENDLANMWVLIANMRNSGIESKDIFPDRVGTSDVRPAKFSNELSSINNYLSGGSEISVNIDKMSTPVQLRLRASYLKERRRSQELQKLISRLKKAFSSPF